MKFKLFKLITVCLATSGLLAPVQAAFGQSGEQQQNLAEAQRLVCVKQVQHWQCDLEKKAEGDSESAKATESIKSSNRTAVPQLLSPTEQDSIANTLIWLSYLVPLSLGLGLFLSDRYCAYRAAVLHQQIERLERMWQYGSDNDATTDSEQGASG